MDRLANPLFTHRMIDGYPRTLTLLAAIGAGVNAGVFFAFSTFVMQGLGHLTAPRGIAAMQAINKQAPTPVFMTALMGTALLSVGAVVVAVANLDEPWAPYLLVGGLLYLAGIALTMTYHVPHNDALALLDPDSAASAKPWSHYLRWWTGLNHVRTVTSLGSAVAFCLALRAA